MKKPHRWFQTIEQWFAPTVLFLVFAWATYQVSTTQVANPIPAPTSSQITTSQSTQTVQSSTKPTDDIITLRIGHWQLESGVRDGFQQLAEDYRREVNPNVRVIQEAVPEGTYGQWVTSQLLGGTPPDMVELGLGLPGPIWLSFKNRYFLPVTNAAKSPNPYNRGTDLENTPWAQTYIDGMKSAYVEELQEYVGTPLSQFAMRLTYNKTLFKKLTGLDTPPNDYRAFIAACDKIAEQKDAKGKNYVAIAGSAYHVGMWESRMFTPLSYGLLWKSDFNRDGFVGSDETFAAFRAGLITFESPELAAQFKVVRDITSRFQTGYSGLTRDEAVFLFAQERAVFIPCGTWDALSFQTQAKGKFDTGMMDFPQVSKDDPELGAAVHGPVLDQCFIGFNFGVTRGSKHPEIAQDFLLYLASRKNNEKLNQIIGWIPTIKGSKLPPALAGFDIQTQGVYGAFNAILGGDTNVKWTQEYPLYQIGQSTYKQFSTNYGEFYKTRGMDDLAEVLRDRQRNIIVQERVLAGLLGDAIHAERADSDKLWNHYQELTAGRLIFPLIEQGRLLRLINNPPEHPIGPYEYSPTVIQQVRQKLMDPANAPK